MRPAEFTTLREAFAPHEEIVRSISNSKNFNSETENPGDAEALLLFRTAKQQAWLVATSERLYGVVDDLRKEKPHDHIKNQIRALLKRKMIDQASSDRPHAVDGEGLG